MLRLDWFGRFWVCINLFIKGLERVILFSFALAMWPSGRVGTTSEAFCSVTAKASPTGAESWTTSGLGAPMACRQFSKGFWTQIFACRGDSFTRSGPQVELLGLIKKIGVKRKVGWSTMQVFHKIFLDSYYTPLELVSVQSTRGIVKRMIYAK